MKINTTDKRLLLLAGILVALVLLFLYNAHLLFPDLSVSLSISVPKGFAQPFGWVSEAVQDWLSAGR